ncbi:MAG: hypothetical protein IJ642_10600 [Oscillospiraceae bacterium]|nr:hypothetical protein [Oscillospiraceae bacterium]
MALNLDTIDIYEFDYNGNSIVVENSELKATITLKINGEVKAEAKGIKAVTGVGALEAKLPSGEIVNAAIQKIKLGDSECKVTVNGTAIALKKQSHDKKDLGEDAAKAVKSTADKAADAAKSAVDKIKNK